MSYASIRSALAARIAAVDDSAEVHEFVRWTPQPVGSSAWNAIHGTPLNVWFVTRSAVQTTKALADDGSYLVQHTIQLLNYVAHNDANSSETDWQDAVDAVVEDLRDGDRTLGGACLTHSVPGGTLGPVEFGGALCHQAVLEIVVEEVA